MVRGISLSPIESEHLPKGKYSAVDSLLQYTKPNNNVKSNVMIPLQDFKTEIKLFLIVALIAVVISVAGIFLLKTLQPAPTEQQVFVSQEECEGQTGFECQDQLCDYKCPRDFRKGWVPTTKPLKQEFDISNWQTYRNEELGFEAKYPEGWSVKVEGPADFPMFQIRNGITQSVFVAAEARNGKGLSLEDLIEEMVRSTWDPEQVGEVIARYEPVTINGTKAFRFDDSKNESSDGFLYTEVLIANGSGKIFTLILDSESSSDDKILDQILSTFQFWVGDIEGMLTPEYILENSSRFDGKTIWIIGRLSLIPFVDTFGLGGAGPGFQTEKGNITVNGSQEAYDAAQDKVFVRIYGMYDAEKSSLASESGCTDCFWLIP